MNKKAIILASVCTILLVLIIILSLIKPKQTVTLNKLNDEKKFFQIIDVINKENNNEESSFLATQIYYQENDLLITYFIKGFELKGIIEQQYKNNVYYLLKTQGVAYKLSKLDNIIDLEEYAKNYIEDEKSLDSVSVLPTSFYNEKNKLFYYLTVFSYLLNYNPKEAYNYLTDNQKNKYNSYYDFENKVSDINNNLSISVLNFKKETKSNEITYEINTSDTSKVTIYEKEIMNFKIEY